MSTRTSLLYIRCPPVACSGLQPHPPHVVALADANALPAQDVVRGRGVKIEVGQRERQQEVFGREREAPLAELEAHIAANETVDFRRGDGCEGRERFRDPFVERRESL